MLTKPTIIIEKYHVRGTLRSVNAKLKAVLLTEQRNNNYRKTNNEKADTTFH